MCRRLLVRMIELPIALYLGSQNAIRLFRILVCRINFNLTKCSIATHQWTHPSNSISGLGCPSTVLPTPPIKPFGGIRPPFSQYETGDGDASTWHSSWTSEPSGAPSNWLGARTVGATNYKLDKLYRETVFKWTNCFLIYFDTALPAQRLDLIRNPNVSPYFWKWLNYP